MQTHLTPIKNSSLTWLSSFATFYQVRASATSDPLELITIRFLLTAHLKLLETPQNRDVLLNAHLYLVKISTVEEREVFKVSWFA